MLHERAEPMRAHELERPALTYLLLTRRPCRARFLQSELAHRGDADLHPATCTYKQLWAVTVGMVCLAWLLACPAVNTDMRKILLSGSWPPRPPQPPSPHAVLLVVPGMKSSVAVARNVVNSVEHMGGQARLDPGPHSRASPLCNRASPL